MYTHTLKGNQVTIIDVRENTWLGGENNFAFMYRIDADHYLVITKDGAIRRERKVYGLVGRLKKLPVATGLSDCLFLKITELATDFSLQHAIADQQLKFYDKQPMDGRYKAVSILERNGDGVLPAQTLQKADWGADDGFAFGFAHRKVRDNVADMKTKTCYGRVNRELVLMSDSDWTDLQERFKEEADRAGFSLAEYHSANIYVNAALIRIAALLGKDATVHPYNMIELFGHVQCGDLQVKLINDDLMIVEICKAQETISKSGHIHSLTESSIINEGSLIHQEASYCGMSCAAFEMIRDYQSKTQSSGKKKTN